MSTAAKLDAEASVLIIVNYIMVPSSSGLGHRPLTAGTRVRTSLGSPLKKPPNGGFFNGDVLIC